MLNLAPIAASRLSTVISSEKSQQGKSPLVKVVINGLSEAILPCHYSFDVIPNRHRVN